MKALKATKFDILWNVGLPRTMPYFFASLKVAITLAFVGSVISETVASNRGIGTMMMIASANFDVPLVFAGVFILAVLGVAALRHLLAGRSARHRVGAPQDRIRHGLTPEQENQMLTRLAALAAGLLAVACACAGAGEDQVHARLENPGHPRLVLLGGRQGLLQGRRARRHDRPGRGLGRDGHAHHERRL